MYLWLGEFIISLIAALIAIFFFADAGTFQDLSTNPVDIGSRAFPRLVCVFLFIFGAKPPAFLCNRGGTAQDIFCIRPY